MKMIYVIGMPGTGKSTIMKNLMLDIGGWENDKPIDLLDTHISNDIRVLGKYSEGEVFCGTDRLSMAVAPKAIEWLSTNPNETIIGEGDRLNNKAFFEKAKELGELYLIRLTVSDKERERRYEERGSNQTDKFIQTVKTKCNNIVEYFGDTVTLFGEEKGCVEEFVNENQTDSKRIVEHIKKIIG